MLRFVLSLIALLLVATVPAQGQVDRDTTQARAERAQEGEPRISIQPDNLPDAARDTISTINVRNADLRDVFRGIGEQNGLNLIVDNAIDEQVTVRLQNLPVIDAIRFLAEEYGLALRQSGAIFRIEQPEEPPPPPPKPPQVTVEAGSLTVDLRNDELREVTRRIAEQSTENVIVSDGVSGTLSGYLERVPLVSGLSTLLENNGYTLRERDGVYVVERKMMGRPSDQGSQRRELWMDVSDGRIDVEANDVPIRAILRELTAQMDLNMVTYQTPEGRLTVTANGLTVDEMLRLLFKGTNVTYRKENETYYVGNRQTSGIASTELVRLDHMKAEGVPEMIPQSLRQQATIKVIPEHNAILLTGTNDVVSEVKSAVRAIDEPTPVILIEALVVDFRTTDRFELGAEFGQDAERSDRAAEEGYRFDEDGFEGQVDDETGNNVLDALEPLVRGTAGIRNIGRLPDDFFLQLRALSQEGKVEIRSRPQVSTLSGHTASLSVGTTQYFILRKETPIQSPGGGVVVQETERFEKIEANVSLEITPWVTSSGEVTTKIRPEFSTPVGSFQSDVPPTISSRVFESTVRLREGETIILGGLIRDDKNVEQNKVPILGSIPLLGRLFRNRSRNVEKSELVIYLTPRIFYGEDNEGQRWQRLREDMDLPPPREDDS